MKRLFRKLGQARLADEQREAQLRRVILVETNVMLPIKLVAMIAASYFYENVIIAAAAQSSQRDIEMAYIAQLNSYAFGNVIFWMLLLASRFGKRWPRTLRFSAFWLAMVDNLFLSGLIYFTGGLDSPLYWLYIGVMIRSAVNFPVFWQQALLNLGACFFYTLAVSLNEEGWSFFTGELYWLRLSVLVLLGACCWGVYLLLERDRSRARFQQQFQLREQSAAATGRLAAEVAHQLKNPLGIINNAAYLLKQPAAKENDQAEADDSVGVIRDEVARCDRILTHLMDYARLSEGRIESLDINRVLETALAQARSTAVYPEIEVICRLAPGLPLLPAQRAQIEECFTNLIQNGLESMPQGGTLTVTSRYRGGGRIEVEIADTGEGISHDKVGKVFEAFYTTKQGGTGLGLTIVKNIVDTYNGSVTVHSAPGQGSCFQVMLPIRAGEAA